LREQALLAAVLPGVTAVPFDWGSATLDGLLCRAKEAAASSGSGGAGAVRLGVVCTAKPGALSLLRGRRTTRAALTAQPALAAFWRDLGDVRQALALAFGGVESTE
jgi:hypothetical protein